MRRDWFHHLGAREIFPILKYCKFLDPEGKVLLDHSSMSACLHVTKIDWQFSQNSDFDVNQPHRKMAVTCRIIILWQINLEKNGLYSLTDWKIGSSYIIEWFLNSYILLELETKRQYKVNFVINVKFSYPKKRSKTVLYNFFGNCRLNKRFYRR